MSARPRIRFGDFAFDPATGELWRGEVAVPLEHQPALALGRLIASAGTVVTRDELAAAVWGAGTHVKFDDGLNYCIRQIRAALGDAARAPRFVETLPRRGYRFVAMTAIETQRPRRPWFRVRVAAAAAFVVALVIAESRPNSHHEVAVAVARSLHDLIF